MIKNKIISENLTNLDYTENYNYTVSQKTTAKRKSISLSPHVYVYTNDEVLVNIGPCSTF